MSAAALLPQLYLLAAVFARIGALVMALPGFADSAVPVRVRLMIALGLSAALSGLVERHIALPTGEIALALLVVGEMLIGLAIGMIIRILFTAITVAGSIASLQTGLTAAMVPDPSMGGQVPILARLLTLAATTGCLAAGLHHWWIAAMVDSYRLFPPGTLPPAGDFAQLLVAVTGRALALGLSLAAPLVIFGLLFNLALGLAGRLAPTIQIFFIAQPLTLLFGLALMGVIGGAMILAFAEAMEAFVRGGWAL